jgi:membrane protease YdiL (CAAX protease family)
MDRNGFLQQNRLSRRSPRSQSAFVLVAASLYVAFSLLARRVYPLFGVVVAIGLVSPVLWTITAGSLAGLGFRRPSSASPLCWALTAGVASSLLGLIVLDGIRVPRDLGKQLLVGLPLWVLIISPFQEFFFRGLIQSSLSPKLGDWSALLLANVAFTAWHYLSPIVDIAPFPLATVPGFTSTFLAGLIYGYVFMRSGSIIAPWLGHAISGITFIVLGAMDLGSMLQ